LFKASQNKNVIGLTFKGLVSCDLYTVRRPFHLLVVKALKWSELKLTGTVWFLTNWPVDKQ